MQKILNNLESAARASAVSWEEAKVQLSSIALNLSSSDIGNLRHANA